MPAFRPAMELMPRIIRARVMDVLSSQTGAMASFSP
jgi:NAD/NADP transhydrogenase alpha subunit